MNHPKGMLIERCRRLGLGKPKFETRSTGPDHDRTFISGAIIAGEVYGTGQGGTKRDAERVASEEALARLERDQTPAPPTLSRPPQGTPVDGPFEGPWPIFAEVLTASLQIANSRVSTNSSGREAIAEVRALALALYKESLEALGEVVEMDDSEELSAREADEPVSA